MEEGEEDEELEEEALGAWSGGPVGGVAIDSGDIWRTRA